MQQGRPYAATLLFVTGLFRLFADLRQEHWQLQQGIFLSAELRPIEQVSCLLLIAYVKLFFPDQARYSQPNLYSGCQKNTVFTMLT
jgi:hypothetical protein